MLYPNDLPGYCRAFGCYLVGKVNTNRPKLDLVEHFDSVRAVDWLDAANSDLEYTKALLCYTLSPGLEIGVEGTHCQSAIAYAAVTSVRFWIDCRL